MPQIDVNHSKWITPATSMRSLIALDGPEFVECAYLTILDRAPDEKGLINYVAQLHNGKSKLDVIRALYGSDEARRVKKRHSWLRWGLLKARISSSSILTLLGASLVGQRHRTRELRARIADLEQRINALTLEVATRRDSDLVPSVNETDPPSLPEYVGHDEKPDFTGVSLVTKRIYAEFSAAVAQRKQRAAVAAMADAILRS